MDNNVPVTKTYICIQTLTRLLLTQATALLATLTQPAADYVPCHGRTRRLGSYQAQICHSCSIHILLRWTAPDNLLVPKA